MTPPLHPRSRLTTSLFGTTLLVSFLVVGMPHIIPCPAPRLAFADSEIAPDGRTRRRRKRPTTDQQSSEQSEEDVNTSTMPIEQGSLEDKAHECPVPKPRGLVGEMLGFGRGEKKATSVRVRVETRKEEKRGDGGGN